MTLAPLAGGLSEWSANSPDSSLICSLWLESCSAVEWLLRELGNRGRWNWSKSKDRTFRPGVLTLLELLQGAERAGALYLLTTVLMVSTQVSNSFWSEVWNKYSALSAVLSRNTNCFLV